MPVLTYEELLLEAIPEVIGNPEVYAAIGARFGDLVGKGSSRSDAETKLMRLLAVLIEDYDRRNSAPPGESEPCDRLRFLLEHSGKTSAALLPVFGQRSHVNEALSGKRKISVSQARKLGEMVQARPSLFLF